MTQHIADLIRIDAPPECLRPDHQAEIPLTTAAQLPRENPPLVAEAGDEPIPRVTQENQDLCRGSTRLQERQGPRIVHVARRPFAGQLARRAREQGTVPVAVGRRELGVPEAVEVVQLLSRGRHHRGMTKDLAEPPRRSRSLRADPDEIRRPGLPAARRPDRKTEAPPQPKAQPLVHDHR